MSDLATIRDRILRCRIFSAPRLAMLAEKLDVHGFDSFWLTSAEKPTLFRSAARAGILIEHLDSFRINPHFGDSLEIMKATLRRDRG